ncbi:MAG: phosphohydrolase [Deltaproteobacteria bacterium]|nr:phosphohydrolase [Deltaproteobacteria bacterium]
MQITLLEMLWLFVLFSLSGWLLEFFFRSFRRKRLVNPGFLKGPWLPIYGICAVLFVLSKTHLQESYILLKILAYLSTTTGLELINFSDVYLQVINFIIKCIVYLCIATGLEFFTGYLFDRMFHIQFWDYSNERYRIKNYVCLKYSLCWLALALGFEYILTPVSFSVFYKLPSNVIKVIIITVAEIILIDFIYRMIQAIRAKRKENPAVTNQQPMDRLLEFADIIKPLYEHPDVARLAKYKHHRETSRLDHSMEVAWLSYVIAKKMSLDYQAVIRGAILHDLFFYDWLSEGPRFHGLRHPRISLKNAGKVTNLSNIEIDIIKKHMWPLTPMPPRYPESWIVCFVDTYCTVKEYVLVLKKVYEE